MGEADPAWGLSTGSPRTEARADEAAVSRRRGTPGSAAVLLCAGLTLLLFGCARGSAADAPVKVGLVAPLSGPSGASGEAIQRGMVLAATEINAAGGVRGRPLAVVARDVPNDPAAGVAALRELADHEQIVAVFGGIYGPVMLAQLDTLAERRLPLIDAWSSVSAITRNGHQ